MDTFFFFFFPFFFWQIKIKKNYLPIWRRWRKTKSIGATIRDSLSPIFRIFSFKRQQKALVQGPSPMQELEESHHNRTYFLVLLKL